ncbi:MAG TPA: M1 family aminopeptidase [Pyrinomonadaceae bacterium]|nr:M1 family aminopeptidase [Pyrinomonadaceae bacterium]
MKAAGSRRRAAGSRADALRAGSKYRFSIFTRCLLPAACCLLACLPAASAQGRAKGAAATGRTSYRINLKLDFEARSFSGTERVRWVNREGGSTSVLYFHLYPNVRVAAAERDRPAFNGKVVPGAEQLPPPAQPPQQSAPSAPDEPRLEVTEVRAAGAGPLPFALEDGGVTLRVQLREAVGEGGAAEVEIAFKGSVPEIDADETSLPAHVVQQVGAALRDTREVRRARDTNFVSRGVMLLGSFHPLLAARVRGEWRRKVEATVGDTVFADVADYEVTVNWPSGVALFTPGEGGIATEIKDRITQEFVGENLRSFTVVAGRTLRSAEKTVGGVRVRSVYTAEHEKVGRRVFGVAAEAARVFTARFGALPLKTISVTEAPLVAGLGSTQSSGLAVIASAFYLDFDSPQMRNLPEIVREQRASVEDSLEFAVAKSVAHQWWGASVGSDPDRAPFLDEALAHWSALLYYQEAHGPVRAKEAEDEQLRGVYQVYRTFGGEDMPADRPAREYRNSFQYAAIVGAKGALMFNALRPLLGEDRFFKALRLYHDINQLKVADADDLREEFFAAVEIHQRRVVARMLTRWLTERRGDEDIAAPDPQLAAALGLTLEPTGAPNRNAFSRLGRFFWRQMTRIR